MKTPPCSRVFRRLAPLMLFVCVCPFQDSLIDFILSIIPLPPAGRRAKRPTLEMLPPWDRLLLEELKSEKGE